MTAASRIIGLCHLDGMRESLLAAGATERDAPKQVAPEARVCVRLDKDGNAIGLRGK